MTDGSGLPTNMRDPGGASTWATNPPGPTAIVPRASSDRAPTRAGSNVPSSTSRSPTVSRGTRLVHPDARTDGASSTPPRPPPLDARPGNAWSRTSISRLRPTSPTGCAPARLETTEVASKREPNGDGTRRPWWMTAGCPSTDPPGIRPLKGGSAVSASAAAAHGHGLFRRHPARIGDHGVALDEAQTEDATRPRRRGEDRSLVP